MKFKILLECKLDKYKLSEEERSTFQWLKGKMRLRLAIDETGYDGFILFVYKVEYLDFNYCKVETEIVTDETYKFNYMLKKNNKLYLTISRQVVGVCKIVDIEKI
jgi:hypothetical protein